MNFRHIQLIIKREYLERLRSPAFIIGTVLGVLGIAGLSFLPQILKLLDQGPVKIAVVDPRNLAYPYLVLASGTLTTSVSAPGPTQAGIPGSRIEFLKADTSDPEILSERVKRGKVNYYLVVEGTSAADVTFKLHAKERPGALTSARLVSLLNGVVTQARLRESNISPSQAAALFSGPSLRVEPLLGGTLKDEQILFQSQALVYILLLLLYVTTVMYGIQVATGVVWEKSSRVMEILITSVRPIELMLGKIFGLGLAGLTQYFIWVAIGLAGLLFSSAGGIAGALGTPGQIQTIAVPPSTLLFFLVFFVLGYLVYAALYAALGSLVNRIEDVNSVTTPLNLIVVAAYLLSFVALGNPDAEFIRWLSFVPFLTPMLMFIRVSLSSPAWWEPALSIVVLVAAILLFAWLAAKIYRVGVLLYGKRPSLREIGRLLRAA